MNNSPQWPNDPNDPHAQDTVAGQYPQWGQPSYPQQAPPPPQYSQPGQFGPPPNPQQLTAKPPLRLRFRAMPRWKRFGTIGCSTIIGAIMVCSLCAIVGNALPKAPQPPVTTIASAPTHQTVQRAPTTKPRLKPTQKPKPTPTATPTPTPSPTATPSPTPTPTPTPMPAPPAQQAPAQQPPAPATQPPPAQQAPVQPTPTPPPPAKGVNGNPWGYDFNPGSYIYNPNSGFCSYFSCVTTFWKSTNGYVVECANNEYSHSGGVSGACSKDGGVQAVLYQHP